MQRLPPEFTLGFEWEQIENIGHKQQQQLYLAGPEPGWMVSIRPDDITPIELHQINDGESPRHVWYSHEVPVMVWWRGGLDPLAIKMVILDKLEEAKKKVLDKSRA